AEGARRACADRLQEAENALAQADRDARAALEAASAAREELARAEERFEGAKRRLTDIGREIRDMLEIEPTAVAELAGIEPGKVLPDLADIEATLERLRRERERLGAVNLRAEEELREIEAQHTTLTTESDDPLEAGLEIMAKPPGKKPSTLSLLSGGEQALTALALIFAVFLTNPAP